MSRSRLTWHSTWCWQALVARPMLVAVAGALMWFPGSLAYLAAVIVAVVRHLNVPTTPMPARSVRPVL